MSFQMMDWALSLVWFTLTKTLSSKVHLVHKGEILDVVKEMMPISKSLQITESVSTWLKPLC